MIVPGFDSSLLIFDLNITPNILILRDEAEIIHGSDAADPFFIAGAIG
jgi:hypothetical protein